MIEGVKKSIPSLLLGLLLGAAGAVLVLKLMCPGGGEPVPAVKPDEPSPVPAVEVPLKAESNAEIKKS